MRYFDLHCDTVYEWYKKGLTPYFDELAVSFKYAPLFKEWRQCFALWIDDKTVNPFGLYKALVSDYKTKITCAPSNLKPILTVEGGAIIENDISRLYTLKNDGIKAITLTWNGKNSIASGAKSEGTLTDFGREVISVMNNLHIACDLSHLNRESFFAAVQLAKFPIATHSCAAAINPHARNLDDEQISLIREKGGIIGICFYPAFLGSGSQFENIYKNILHFIDNGLENNIAIGSDFDGADMDLELDNVGKIPNLYAFLSAKGLSAALLNKIFYENAAKFFEKL